MHRPTHPDNIIPSPQPSPIPRDEPIDHFFARMQWDPRVNTNEPFGRDRTYLRYYTTSPYDILSPDTPDSRVDDTPPPPKPFPVDPLRAWVEALPDDLPQEQPPLQAQPTQPQPKPLMPALPAEQHLPTDTAVTSPPTLSADQPLPTDTAVASPPPTTPDIRPGSPLEDLLQDFLDTLLAPAPPATSPLTTPISPAYSDITLPDSATLAPPTSVTTAMDQAVQTHAEVMDQGTQTEPVFVFTQPYTLQCVLARPPTLEGVPSIHIMPRPY